MARLLVLDAGPLGLACGNPTRVEVEKFALWASLAQSGGAFLFVPAIADYEVRRGLMHVNASASLQRLDRVCSRWRYISLDRVMTAEASRLWAKARAAGSTISDASALGADALIAAQALSVVGIGDMVTIVTENIAHLSRFAAARRWEDITP